MKYTKRNCSKIPLTVQYQLEDYRPWGHYRVLDEEKNSYKLKKLTLSKGKGISYQMHQHRSEHWVIVKGVAQVTIDGELIIANKGESIFVKAGQKHSIKNIEVQM